MARCAHLRSRFEAAPALLSPSRILSFSWLHQLQQSRSSSLLSYEEVSAGSPTSEHPVSRPSRTLFVLHGLLGCGRNWRTWSRRLVEAAAAGSAPEGGPWRAVLLDMRCHGGSTTRPGLQPPHNMLTAAHDVSRLIQHLMGAQAPGAVLGHSMGGKVALALLQQAAARGGHQHQHHQHQHPERPHHLASVESTSAAAAAAAVGVPEWCTAPRQLWVLDSQPGLVTLEQDAGTGISRVLNTVHSVPLPIPSRAWLLRHLRERGLSEPLSAWLASNLVQLPQQHHHHHHHHHQHQHPSPHHQQQHHHHHPPGPAAAGAAGGDGGAAAAAGAAAAGGGPFTWSFDIHCAGAMYMSYRTTEFWHILENPPYGTAVHLVQGARSDRWPEAMQRRLIQAAATAAASAAARAPTGTTPPTLPASAARVAAVSPLGKVGGSFEHHVLERAGHWLHVDNPEGLLQLVLPRLAGL